MVIECECNRGKVMDAGISAAVQRFTYRELEIATNKFRVLIGEGGSGKVYYGKLLDDREVITLLANLDR